MLLLVIELAGKSSRVIHEEIASLVRAIWKVLFFLHIPSKDSNASMYFFLRKVYLFIHSCFNHVVQ